MSRAFRVALAGGALMAACVWAPGAARADTQQQADALFSEGRELLEKGRWAEACAKLKESEQLAPAVGTLLNLGYCWEQLGRMRSAMEAYAEAEVIAGGASDQKRAATARERYAAAEKKASRLVVKLAPEAPSDVEISRNGTKMPKTDLDRPIPVDPEEVVLVASAAAHQSWRGIVTVRGDGATITVVVPALQPASGGGAATTSSSGAFTPKRILALGLAGLGLGAIGASIGAGLSAKSRFDDAAPYCSDGGCDPIGVGIQERAAAQGNIATLLFFLGVAAVGGGVYFWIAGAPPASGPSQAGNVSGLGGRF
ncbi:MAG: hypothetical protein JST00_28270 [Deltaproteobacteria bacterium]|nr:hypothetical protein [Deltaproteobacteria bacterium]